MIIKAEFGYILIMPERLERVSYPSLVCKSRLEN